MIIGKIYLLDARNATNGFIAWGSLQAQFGNGSAIQRNAATAGIENEIQAVLFVVDSCPDYNYPATQHAETKTRDFYRWLVYKHFLAIGRHSIAPNCQTNKHTG